MMKSFASKYHVPKAYFLSHSAGPRLKHTPRLDACHQVWREEGGNSWAKWPSYIEEFKDLLAQHLKTSSAQICPSDNITSGLCKVLSCLPPAKGNQRILLSQYDFPSLGFALKQLEHLGYSLDFLPKDANICDPQVWSDALTSDHKVVLLTHSTSHDGRLIPMQEIANQIQRDDLLIVADVAHSFGVVPIDLSSSHLSVVVGSCLKWPCGGPGAGFLWINQTWLQRLHPRNVGWFSHENPFEFDIHNFQYAESADRFFGGTPGVFNHAIAADSLEVLSEIGAEAIFSHNQNMRSFLRENLAEIGVSVLNKTNPNATLFLDLKEAEFERLSQQVFVDRCAGGVRVSPHFFTTEDDCLFLLEQLKN